MMHKLILFYFTSYTTDFMEESSHFIAIKPDIVSHFLFEILLTFSMYKRSFKPQ